MVSFSVIVSCADKSSPVETDVDLVQQKKLKEVLANPLSIGFREVKAYVLDKACLSCHNPSQKEGDVDMSTYEALTTQSQPHVVVAALPEESSLYQTVSIKRGKRQMPPQGHPALTRDQKDLIYEWIKNGAKNQAADGDAPSLAEQLQYYFDNPQAIDYEVIQNFVFKPGHCTKCHSESGSTPSQDAMLFGADMTSYNTLGFLNGIVRGYPVDQVSKGADNVPFVYPGSNIYKAVAVTQSMPPAEEGYEPLNALRIKLLRLWITNCAIETDTGESKKSLLSDAGPDGKVRSCY